MQWSGEWCRREYAVNARPHASVARPVQDRRARQRPATGRRSLFAYRRSAPAELRRLPPFDQCNRFRGDTFATPGKPESLGRLRFDVDAFALNAKVGCDV